MLGVGAEGPGRVLAELREHAQLVQVPQHLPDLLRIDLRPQALGDALGIGQEVGASGELDDHHREPAAEPARLLLGGAPGHAHVADAAGLGAGPSAHVEGDGGIRAYQQREVVRGLVLEARPSAQARSSVRPISRAPESTIATLEREAPIRRASIDWLRAGRAAIQLRISSR